jgi:hypothetical protein
MNIWQDCNPLTRPCNKAPTIQSVNTSSHTFIILLGSVAIFNNRSMDVALNDGLAGPVRSFSRVCARLPVANAETERRDQCQISRDPRHDQSAPVTRLPSILPDEKHLQLLSYSILCL